VVGLILLLVLWEVLALTLFARRNIVPTPVAVAQQMWQDRGFYGPHVTTTLGEAATGYLWGNAVALVLAVLFVQVVGSERLLLRLAIATYCMPIIAIGPLLKIVMSGTSPNAVLAGLSVILTTLIGAMLGLRSADRGTLEVIRAYGGGT
jgi:sulfonate transport system permease protein